MRLPHWLSKRTIIVFSALAVLFAAGWFVLGKTTFLATTAMRYAKPVLEEKINAKFSSSPFEGNPLTGFIVRDVALSQNGVTLLSAKELRVTFAAGSSFVNFSPKIDIEAVGVHTSFDNINKLIPESKSTEPTEIIVSNVKLQDAEVQTQFGLLQLDKGSLEIENSQSFAANVHAKIEGLVDFSLKGAVMKTDGNWTAEDLKLTLDNGSAEVNGAFYPAINAEIKTNKLNLSKITSIFPEVRAFGVRGVLSSNFTLKYLNKQLETAGKMSLHNALLHGIPVEDLSVNWNYDKGLLHATFNDAGIRNSALSGYVNYDGRNKNASIDMDVSASKFKLASLTDQFKQQLGKEQQLPEGIVEGARVRLKGPLSKLTGKIALVPSDISYGDFMFKKLGGTVVFNGGQSGSLNFAAIHNGKPVSLKGSLSFAPNVPTNMKLSATGFKLEELYKAIPALKSSNAKGIVALDATVTGTANHWKLNTKLSSQQLTADEIGVVQNLKLDSVYLFENGNMNIKALSAVWNGAKITASGVFDNTKRKPSIKISGSFSGAHTDRFYKLFEFMDAINLKISVDGNFAISGAVSDPVVEASLFSPQGGTVMKELQINSASTKMIYKNSKVIADKLNFVTPYGTLLSHTESTIKNKTSWSWEASFDKLRMSILNGIFGLNEDIHGITSGKVKVYGVGSELHWEGDFNNSRFVWRTVRFDSLSGKLHGTKELINLDHLGYELCKGKGVVNGTVRIGNSLEDSALNVDVSASDVNLYEVIRRHLPSIRNIQGTGHFSGTVTGSLREPHFAGKAVLSPLRIGIAYIPEARAELFATMDKIRFSNVSLLFPQGIAEGKAFLGKMDGKWHTAFDLNATNIELSKLFAFADNSVRSSLKGKVNVQLKAKCPLDELTVNGTLTADSLQLKGVHFEQLNAPFYYTDKYLVIEEFNVNSNSGHITGGFAYNTQSNFWGARFAAKDFDVGTAFEKLYGKDKPGKITGKADLKLRVGGDSMKLSRLNMAGTLLATNGEISSFKFLDAAKKYTKGNPLRFTKLQTTFRFDNGTLILLPGTQAVAPAGDPVYRMAMVDGYITPKGELSLLCLGKFNIRALNSILGGVSGILDMTRTITTLGINNIDSKELLQNVLGGVLGGATRSSFRFVSIGLGGTITSPKLTKLVVESDARRRNKGTTIPVSNSDPDDKKQLKLDGDVTFNLHFEIPIGYGKNSEPGDFAGQFMQDTLKSLISNITF